MAGLYSAAGKINTTTVVGNVYTGVYAADGSVNVVLDDAVNKGAYHPCGAYRVSTTSGSTVHHASGSTHTNRLLGPGR